MAAAGARIWTKADFDLTAVAWLFGALALLSIGSGVLYLLEPEIEGTGR